MKGHIRKRGSRWSFVLDMGTDENGKRKQKWFSGYPSRPAAEKAMAKTIDQMNEGTFIEPSNETMKEYMKTWLANKKANVRTSTYEQYYYLTKNQIVPHLGKYKLSKLNAVHIQRFYGKLRQQGTLSPTTINRVHNVLKNALNSAVKYGFINKNPALAVDTPKKANKEIQYWDEVTARRFLEYAKNDRLHLFFYLAIMTGMRRGEILGLRWKDIDLEKQTLTVNQALSPKGDTFQETKTASGKRTISVSKNTVAELQKRYAEARKEKMKAGPYYENLGLVICTDFGTPILPRNVNRTWYRLLKKSGLPRIRLHDLRHTHATILLKQGVHPKVVSERLGHSSIQITLDTYSHVLPGIQESAAAQFEEEFFKSEGKNEDSQ